MTQTIQTISNLSINQFLILKLYHVKSTDIFYRVWKIEHEKIARTVLLCLMDYTDPLTKKRVFYKEFDTFKANNPNSLFMDLGTIRISDAEYEILKSCLG